ncbi:MAG TPA: enolase C-terminal domain-like protein [Solirubrobacteraceae bacterium]|nr:enolase C-terminal domain-like protein [Solirubrobacteraceae bacterium]
MRLEFRERSLRLAAPLRTATGLVSERPLVQVSLTDADGLSGYGEAAPLPGYDGVTVARVTQSLERYGDALDGCDAVAREQLLGRCREVDDLPQALAAVDLALWDREGRLRRAPVAALLSEHPATRVAVNATIGAGDVVAAAQTAAAAREQGYGCVKVKVGLCDDAERVAAVRAGAGADMALRVDANGAWTVPEAAAAIGALSSARLELVEEPVHGVAAIRELRDRVQARIAIDETAAEPGALGAGAADAVCLKISRCGGITGLLAAARQVHASGAAAYLASTLDGPLGIAAALHAAAALQDDAPLPHCGLATLALFADLEDPLPVRAGQIAVPRDPGLGVGPL